MDRLRASLEGTSRRGKASAGRRNPPQDRGVQEREGPPETPRGVDSGMHWVPREVCFNRVDVRIESCVREPAPSVGALCILVDLDRQSVIDWYRRNRRRSRGALRSDRAVGLLFAAHRAAQPHRVLRRPPAGLQRDRVSASRARPAAASTRASSSCSRAASIPKPSRPPSRAAARRPCGRRATKCARLRGRADDAVVAASRWSQRRPAMRAAGALHRARARGDASGDAALHVASPAVRRRSGVADRTAVRDYGAWRGRDRRPRSATASRCRRAWRRSARDAAGYRLRLGQRVRRASAWTVPRFRHRRPQRHQRRLPGVRRGRRLPHRVAVVRRRLGLACSRTRRRIRCSGSQRRRRSGSGAACSRPSRCRRRGRSTSATRKRPPTRAGRADACRPKRSSTAPPSGRRPGTSGRIRGATRRRTRRAASSISQRSIQRRSARSRRAPAPGACTTSWATAGSGRPRSSDPSTGSAPMASYPEYSADFFDGQHYVMKGGFAGHGRASCFAAASATGSGRTIRTSTRSSDGEVAIASDVAIATTASCEREPSRRSRSIAATSPPTCGATWRSTPKQLPVEVSLRRARLEPLRGHLPAAVVSHHARRAAAARRARRRIVGVRSDDRRSRVVELGCGSGEKLAILAEALQARRRPRPRPPDRHLAAGARAVGAHAGRLRHVSVVGHRATYEDGLRRAAAARDGAAPCWSCSSARTSATSTRRRRTSSCAGSARALAPGDLAAARRRSGQAGGRAAARLRRSARRDGRVQQEPARPHQPRAGRRLRSRRLRAPRACGTRRARVEMHLVSRARQTRARSTAAGSTSPSRAASGSGPRARTSTTPSEIEEMGLQAGFAMAEQWVEQDAGFALTLFSAV